MTEIRSIEAEQTLPLRTSVLGAPGRQDLRFPGDEQAMHLGGFIDGELVCVGTFMPAPEPGSGHHAWRLRGMATHPDHRGSGIGSALLREGMHRIAEQGGRVLWCNARTPAVAFYRRHGLRIVGEEFDIEHAGPHFRMRVTLDED